MIYEFQQAMQDIGLTIDTLIANRNIHRVPVVGKRGKPGRYAAKEELSVLHMISQNEREKNEKQQIQAVGLLIVAGIKVLHVHILGLARGEVRT